MTSNITDFNNEVLTFVSVNSNKGILNVYILFNSRKILSKDKSKDNFLKIPFKDVGTDGEKKFSAIIVNDIRMDFSINLIQKTMNYNKNKPDQDIGITIRPKVQRIFRKDKKDEKKTLEKKKSFDDKEKSKLPAFRKAVKALVMADKLRSLSNNKERKNTLDPTHPIYVEEKHEEINRDEDMLSQDFPFLKNYSISKNNTNINKIKEEKDGHRLRAHHNSYVPEKNKTLTQLITAEIKLPKKLNTIKTEEIFLDPANYENYLIEKKGKNKKANLRETFCEGFFISSFPQKDGQVVEKSQSFPASCGHKQCSELPAMKPEIIVRYPLEDTKTLELNNLAATICFPTGIKVCYSENEPKIIKDYVTPITNQKGERYYMMTYHFYLKMENDIYSKNYEMHPLKHHLMKFADEYLNMSEEEIDKGVTEKIQNDLLKAQDLGFRDFVYIPYCICLISKYPYVSQMKKCLQSIYNLIIKNSVNVNDEIEKNKLNNLIMHIINSVPIPDIKTRVHFYIPYFSKGIKLKCPKLNDLKIMNTTISDLLNIFSIDNIVTIFRFLIFEKKILFIDDDYTRLTNVTDNFISLLYPFQWMHTYIPIMSDQMLKYLETFLPFLNGIHSSLMPLVTELFQTGDMEESEEMYLIYINENKLKLGSTLIGKNIKINKYIEDNMPNLPSNLEKDLKYKLKKIKDDIYYFQKKNPLNSDLSEYNLKIRNAFIEMFVQMFHGFDKYMCFLDDDVVFNKNLFLETIPKEEKNFYNEFIDTQLFQLFTQNIVDDELDYFKYMTNEYNKKGKFASEEMNEEIKEDYIKKIYLITPDYLGINSQNKKKIEMEIREKYALQQERDEEGLIIDDRRITEHLQKIDNSNYNNSNCNIYLIPEKVEEQPAVETGNTLNLLSDMLTNESHEPKEKNTKKYGRTKTKINKNELTEKEQDAIKEKIKDFTVKIFKSEDIETEDTHLKKDLQNDLNTNIGREFFVNLLAKNTSNIILLKDNAFQLLGTLIYNTLLYILQVEENSKILEQIVILIKSTMFFGKEEIQTIGYFITEEKKNTITLWNIYKHRIERYPKVNQANLWVKWYEINISLEKAKEYDEVKKKVILNLCDLMIGLKLIKSFIKNTLEKLVKKVFERNEELGNAILQEIIQKIIKAKYISKANHEKNKKNNK